MRIIREVDEKELDELARITVEAFPGMKIDTPEARQRMIERLAKVMKEPVVHFFGVFDDTQMVGVMRCYDFTMKLQDVYKRQATSCPTMWATSVTLTRRRRFLSPRPRAMTAFCRP